MVEANELNSNAVDEVLLEMMKSKESPRTIANTKNLLQVSDESQIASIVDEVLDAPESAKAVEDLKSGNEKVIGYLVGQVMRKSAGKANPTTVQKIIKERIK